MKQVLVIGASGFIGRRLVELMRLRDEFQVTALVRDRAKSRNLKRLGVGVIVADIADQRAVKKAVEGFDIVINLAHDFKRNKKANIDGFNNLLEACITSRIQHLIHISSIVVYAGWPTRDVTEESTFAESVSDYKSTKITMEQFLETRSVELYSSILQPTIVYGPKSWLWTDYLVEKLEDGTVFLPSSIDGLCNALYVDDLVEAIILAAFRQGNSAEKYIVSGPEPVLWKQYLESYNQLVGRDSIRYIDFNASQPLQRNFFQKLKLLVANPLRLAQWGPLRYMLNLLRRVMGDTGVEGLRKMVKRLKSLSGRPIYYYPDAFELELYDAKGVCSIKKARQELGYSPQFNFEAGFKLTADYIQSRPGG